MSVATELRSPENQDLKTRAILGPAGNGVRVSEETKRKNEVLKKPQKPVKLVTETPGSTVRNNSSVKPQNPVKLVAETPGSAVRNNSSVDSTCSSDSSTGGGGGSSVKKASSKPRLNHNAMKSVKVVPDGIGVAMLSPVVSGPVKRCDWITEYSGPLYTSFHDEEWGVPAHDDRKLFELLVLSQALAEFTWPAILSRRDIFRKLFDKYDPSSIAKYTENKLHSMRSNGSTFLSEPKLRAIVDNAKHTLKIQQEFGSFSNYCWSFVNHKSIRNGFRYARQIPAKTPKAELMSKDLMQRGFRCVGPSVVYSFMQVAGLANDHLITCFRYQECNNSNLEKDPNPKKENVEVPTNATENTSSSTD